MIGRDCGVHQIARVVRNRTESRRDQVVACQIAERAAIELKVVGQDADAVCVGITKLNGVLEDQRRAVIARGIGRSCILVVAHGQHELSVATGDGGSLTHRERHTHHIAEVQGVVLQPRGAGDGHATDGGGCVVHQITRVGRNRRVRERCCCIAHCIAERAAIECQAVGRDADAVWVRLVGQNGVRKDQCRGAIA